MNRPTTRKVRTSVSFFEQTRPRKVERGVLGRRHSWSVSEIHPQSSRVQRNRTRHVWETTARAMGTIHHRRALIVVPLGVSINLRPWNIILFERVILAPHLSWLSLISITITTYTYFFFFYTSQWTFNWNMNYELAEYSIFFFLSRKVSLKKLQYILVSEYYPEKIICFIILKIQMYKAWEFRWKQLNYCS